MTGPIFVFNPEGALVPIFEKPYESEAIFQEMLAKYPELLLGGDERTPYSGLLLIAREQGIAIEEGGGNYFSLDHLFVDQNGVPTLVEVKRRSDTRNRREIVAQMLDYASNGLATWTVEDLRCNFEQTWTDDGKDPTTVLTDFLGEGSDPEGFWLAIEENIRTERIRMVFVADEISPELRRIVAFLNRQMRSSEMLAIELRQYIGQGVQAFVPDVIVKPEALAGNSMRGTIGMQSPWTEERFMAALSSRSGSAAVGIAMAILEWGKRTMSTIEYGRGTRDGSLLPILMWKGTDYYPVILWTYGRVEVQFQWLQTRPPFDDIDKRREFLTRLNSIPGISLPIDSLNRRPSFPLKELEKPDTLEQFIEVLDWVIREIKTNA